MEIKVETEGSETIVAVAGEVDAHNCNELGEAILGSATSDEPTVVLDATELSFIDSSAISELLRVRQDLVDRNGSLTITGAGTSVHRVLEITGLLETFGIA